MQEGSSLAGLLPLVAIFAIFYFLVILPQQRQNKKHKQMLGDLKKGDKILTNGGLMGTVSSVEEEYIKVEIASSTIVKMRKEFIAKNLNDEA